MKYTFVLLLAIGTTVAWAQTSGGTPNTLAAEEKKDGFELLFDGKSLDKFNVPADQEKVWKVVNGVIRNESATPGATILTKEAVRRDSRQGRGLRAMKCRSAIRCSPIAPAAAT